MKKQVSVFLIAAAVLAAVFVAGCTSQTASPTPSAVPSTATTNATAASVKPIAPTTLPNSTDLSSFFTSYMQGQGYTVLIPFNKSVSNTTGNDQYTGALTDGKYVYGASVELGKSSAGTTSAFNAATTDAQQRGYTPVETNSTTWIGLNSNNGYVVYVTQDTTDYFVVTLVATSTGSG